MFTLDAMIIEISAAMFVHAKGVVANIDLWHKHIGHVNIQQLKKMHVQDIVVGLPKFKMIMCIRYVRHANCVKRQGKYIST